MMNVKAYLSVDILVPRGKNSLISSLYRKPFLSFMYSLRPCLTRVNYRMLSGLQGLAEMSDSGRNVDDSDERDTEQCHVPPDQDPEKIPNHTIEELEAL